MINTSITPETLQSFEYYESKIPLYLKNSYGFMEHFRIWYEVLKYDVVDNADLFLNLLMIFDPDYLNYLESIDETMAKDTTVCDILDKIGSISGVRRFFTVTYEQGGEEVTENLILNNEEFLILIKAQIIKNYCEGTREQMEEYYKSVGLELYVQSSLVGDATADLYLIITSGQTVYNYSDNIKKMFLAGMFTIQSVGIKYDEALIDADRLLFWSEEESEEVVENGWGDAEYNPVTQEWDYTIALGGEWIR